MSEDEDSRDLGVSEKKSDLPRIVVDDDRIVVEEGDWVERDILGEEFEGVDEDSEEEIDVDKLLEDGVVLSDKPFVRDDEESELEESVGGGEVKREEVEVYNSRKGSNEFYAEEAYGGKKEDYEVGVGGIGEVAEFEELRPGERSMLEVAGFRDEEAEKRRKEKRDFRY
ncbi:hypothetical protein HNV12_01400 [Methanococcoides sp. SA1]|nr:hypothetical protein [Methanococcoides sp. SA1]